MFFRRKAAPLPDAAPLATLSLYHYRGCYYCERVRRSMKALGISLEERDVVGDREHMQELVEARGRRTVPVLRIEHPEGGSTWLPESKDIVRYLEANFG